MTGGQGRGAAGSRREGTVGRIMGTSGRDAQEDRLAVYRASYPERGRGSMPSRTGGSSPRSSLRPSGFVRCAAPGGSNIPRPRAAISNWTAPLTRSGYRPRSDKIAVRCGRYSAVAGAPSNQRRSQSGAAPRSCSGCCVDVGRSARKGGWLVACRDKQLNQGVQKFCSDIVIRSPGR